ncbi:hypothetical protein [Paenibacillus sp. FSL H7-0326]|uniref:hypothetical protein n=1 Tax=Paenibacillus sp. FSL H7-0326 TaxID=1921144 RepID=UPI0021162B9F|nr:hypothetical protein [Paenibacillus sp. FSL H7-0326]
MKQYINTIKTENVNNFTVEFNRLENIIFPSFLEWDNCVLLSQQKESELPTHFSSNQFVSDRTAFEADYNHIHLNDIFDEGVHPDLILNIGIKILEVWTAVLYKEFNGLRKFMLILSYDAEEVVLRFYNVRKNEVPWLDSAKLDSYLDGLMLIEI